MRSASLCASSAEKLFLIEQCRSVCGRSGIAFSRERARQGSSIYEKGDRKRPQAFPISQIKLFFRSPQLALGQGQPLVGDARGAVLHMDDAAAGKALAFQQVLHHLVVGVGVGA